MAELPGVKADRYHRFFGGADQLRELFAQLSFRLSVIDDAVFCCEIRCFDIRVFYDGHTG
ncbi:hypothetical protein BFN05_21185 [Bacillus licheniformis]|nr:hypothetical protein BFN05_21185 [Bacillus licheniformis]